MPAVTESTMVDSKGEVVTDFIDSVGTSSVSYTYTNTQTSLYIRNDSDVSITVTVGGSPTVIARYADATITAEYSSFSIVSASGIAAFYARSIRGVTTNNVSATSLNVVSGSQTDPSISAIGDANTGMFFPASETVAFTTNGTEKVRINSDGQLVTRAGTVSLPAITPTGDSNTGIFFPAADTIAFGENGTEVMRITSAGYVGIGVNPNVVLHAKDSGEILRLETTSASGNNFIRFRDSATKAFFGFNNASTDVFVINNVENSDMIFYTNNTDRLYIEASGTTRPAANNTYDLGSSSFRWATIYAQNALNTSDARLKMDVQPSILGLNFINALNPVSYKWIEGGNTVSKDEEGNDVVTPIAGVRTHFGLIAQEVKAALPNDLDFAGWCLADKNNPDSIQSLGYTELIAPMIKAIQELTEKVEALEAQLNQGGA